MFLPDQGFPFWGSLSELQQERIRNYTVIRQFHAGEYQDKTPGYYWVYDGDIALLSCHSSGRRRTILEAREFETMFLTVPFLKEIAPINPELYARKASEVWFIPRDNWFELLESVRELKRFTIDLLSDQMAAMAIGMGARMEKDISQRLSIYLLRLCNIRKTTSISVSHEELAEMLGTTREAITRNISILKDNGLVVTGRNKISIVNMQAMREYINQTTDDEHGG
ncbi:MAG: Crp/Fnr family transcriptional regulator [Lachnospiraceae bacterium]|nr:Crp/Fnr family transcriptional regulator [Lachnospiraceae bacterium]